MAARWRGRPEAELTRFLAGCRLLADDRVTWAGAAGTPAARLRCRAFAIGAMPPLDLVTSARCVVLRGDHVLTLVRATGAGDEAHIVPGGRREPGESLEQTARREVLEETGWEVGAPTLLGCAVFRHITPRPPGYGFPYPAFVQVVFTAEAARYRPESMAPDEIDGEASFVPIADAHRLAIATWQRALLRLARAVGAPDGAE